METISPVARVGRARAVSRFPNVLLLFRVLLASCVSPLTLATGEMRVNPIIVDSSGAIIELAGLNNGSHVLEASQDLTNWFTVAYDVATNSTLRLTHQGAGNFQGLYYRGRTALPPLKTTPQPDTNWAEVTVITTDGGSAELYPPDGCLYRLTVASNAVLESVMLSMTWVTNIIGYPLAQPMVASVQFAPADLLFLDSTVLEIEFPTNVNTRDLAAFAFDADGGNFRLTPLLVGDRSVRIPLAQCSGIAVGPVSRAEAAASPWRYVPDAFDAEAQLMAAQLHEDRVSPISTASRRAARSRNSLPARRQALFSFESGPLLDLAKRDCTKFIRKVSNLKRTFWFDEVLGMNPPPKIEWLQTDAFCEAATACQGKLLYDCFLGKKSNAAVESILRWNHLRSFLCGKTNEENENGWICAPARWIGTLTYKESGAMSTNYNNGFDGKTFYTAKYLYEMAGLVESVQEQVLPIAHLISLRLSTQAFGYKKFHLNYTFYDACEGGRYSTPGMSDISSSAAGQSANVIGLQVQFTKDLVIPGLITNLAPAPTLTITLPATEGGGRRRLKTIPATTECDPRAEGLNDSFKVSARFYPAVYSQWSSSVAAEILATNRIKAVIQGAAYQTEGFEFEGVRTTYEFKLDLFRAE